LILETEIDSITGLEQSKAIPAAAIVKFATIGTVSPQKDIGLFAIRCGNISIAQIAFGTNNAHPVKRILEADTRKLHIVTLLPMSSIDDIISGNKASIDFLSMCHSVGYH
jgi:hypothetical protein